MSKAQQQHQQNRDSDSDVDFDPEQFESTSAGSDTVTRTAKELKVGDYLVVKGRALKVVDADKYKNGKHGSSKVTIDAVDVITGRNAEVVAPASFQLTCPVLVREEFLLVDIDDEDFALTLLDGDSNERRDVFLPMEHNEPLARAIRAHFTKGDDVTVVAHTLLGVTQIVAFKTASCGK